MWVWIERTFFRRGRERELRWGRLNALLPVERPKAELELRAEARKKFEALAKLAIPGSFTALAALVGLFQFLKPEERSQMAAPALCFVAMFVCAAAAAALDITEPVLRARVVTRLDDLDPQATYEDLTDRHWTEEGYDEHSVSIVRRAVQWRALSLLRVGALVGIAAFATAGLLLAIAGLT